jgi:hypothetical protein
MYVQRYLNDTHPCLNIKRNVSINTLMQQTLAKHNPELRVYNTYRYCRAVLSDSTAVYLLA